MECTATPLCLGVWVGACGPLLSVSDSSELLEELSSKWGVEETELRRDIVEDPPNAWRAFSLFCSSAATCSRAPSS
eukprot:CAMPEP_0173224266 /NCGR_PEP_ID=MMETSP1142-20121109/4239_1 /TAXON_ID=483371 /ORGANISM="non described non described, Strain CCMP2298" /LENGTH=75 /DNA_ID=CAMNT_0014152505 /DNA_START=240 /DNA_END=464 /DNA_ORIENTATION=+